MTITVNGAGFVAASLVKWNGNPIDTTFVSSHQLLAQVPAPNLIKNSTAYVSVSNPAPGGGTSNPVPFTITDPTTSLSFTPKLHASPVPASNLLVADFNGDGNSDLAIFAGSDPACGQSNGAISILLGKGQGGFTPKSTICTTDNIPTSGVVGDFNHDGNLDLAVIADPNCQGCASITIYLGNGDGTFTFFASYPPDGLDGSYLSIVTADFNHDGNLDLVVSFLSDIPNVAIYLGNGDGTFSAAGLLTNAYVDSNSLAVGDFNDDGILDIASVGPGADQSGIELGPVAIFLGNGDGTFTPAPTQPNVSLVDPSSVVTGGFTGDGILDLVIADSNSPLLTVLKGNGDGTFTQVNGEPQLPENSTLIGMADFNGDGKLDLAYSIPPNTLNFYLGNGDGTFATALTGTVNNAQFGGGAVGDFNGDGRFDLAIANSSNTFFVLRQRIREPQVSIALTSAKNPGGLNQPVPFTATVTARPFDPTGSVTFKQGTTVLGTAPLIDGHASFTFTFNEAGRFPITATYSGDQNYSARISNIVLQTIDKYATSISMSASPNPSNHDQSVTFSAVVQSNGPSPTGIVAFKKEGRTIGTGTLVNGLATFTKSNLLPGTYTISAMYGGDAESAQSTSPFWQQVVN